MEGKNKLKKEIAGHGKAAQLSTYPRGIKEKDPKKKKNPIQEFDFPPVLWAKRWLLNLQKSHLIFLTIPSIFLTNIESQKRTISKCLK